MTSALVCSQRCCHYNDTPQWVRHSHDKARRHCPTKTSFVPRKTASSLMAQCLQTQCDMKATRQFQKFRQRLLLRNPTRVLLKSGRPKGYTIAVVLTLVVLVDYQVKSQNNSSYQNNTSSSGFDLVDKNGQSAAVFDAAGKMKLPTGYRKWGFVGAR